MEEPWDLQRMEGGSGVSELACTRPEVDVYILSQFCVQELPADSLKETDHVRSIYSMEIGIHYESKLCSLELVSC